MTQVREDGSWIREKKQRGREENRMKKRERTDEPMQEMMIVGSQERKQRVDRIG